MKQGRKRLTRRIATFCGVMLAVVIIAWLVVLGLGISIPLDDLRKPVETAATRALGREVRIGGVLAFRPTVSPIIVAHDVRIVSPAGQHDLLRAGRIAVRLDPAALLRGEPRSVGLLIEDIDIDLDTTGAGAPGTGPAEASAGEYPPLLTAGAELLARQPELQQLVLRRVMLNYRDDRTGQAGQVKLDEVNVNARTRQSLELMLRGHFQQQPYTINLTTSQLADLLASTGPRPLHARVNFADTRLWFDGNLEASRQELVATFDLRVDWPAEFAMVAASLGQAPLAGQLSLRTDRGRPVVAGELRLSSHDTVLRFGSGTSPAGGAADQSDRGGEAQANRPVSVPLAVSIAAVPFHGELVVAGQGTEPVVELALSATDADAGGLLAGLTGTTGIRGRFRHVGFQASARGSDATAMVNRLALALQVDGARLSYGHGAGEQPVAVNLDELALTLPAGETMAMRVQGVMLDEPFTIEFTAGGLEALLVEETWPIALLATGGGAVLDVSGPLAAHTDSATRLNVGLYGKRIGDLSAWLGVSPCAAASYALRGQLVLAKDVGRLQFLQLQTDRTQLNGELDWSGDDQVALLHAVLHFEALDPADIEALIPLVNRDADEGAARGIAVDMPVLPGRIEIINADIDLAIAHILLELVDISEVSLSAQVRDGKLQRSPFHAHIGKASFQGYLDPTSAETAVVFESEDDDSAAGGRMDKLFSSAVRWVGDSAVVPLRWIFRKKFFAGDPADCELQGAGAGN